MHVVLASVGSLGDIHPFIAIGRELQRRGHRATLICNDDFADRVEAAGIGFESAGAAVDLERTIASPNLWHPIKGLGVVWRHMLAPSIVPTFRHIERIAAAGSCLVVAPPALFGARFARERLGVRLISAYTAPAILRSDRAPLTMAHWRLPRGTPRALVRLAWRALDRHKLHPMAANTLQRLAAEIDVAPPPASSSIFGDWMHSPDGGITLFPDWFAPRRAGWPAGLRFGGFPLYSDDAEAGLPDRVRRFLDAGPAPLIFMPGSAMRHAQPFFAAAIGASLALGERAILLTPERGQLPPGELPPQLLHADYLPFAALLPRARALIHHGGIGSCAQALHAGIAQLTMPMAHDQFDNAECLRRLGVGAALRPRDFDAARLTWALKTLLATPRARLQACRDRLAEPALPQLCAQIEALA